MAARPPKPEFTSVKCDCKISYDFTESLLVLFQKSSGQQTHEVLSTLESLAMQMAEDFEIDLYNTHDMWYWNSWRSSWREETWKRITKKIALTYPGTDINFYLEMKWYSGTKSNSIRFNFYTPIKKITYSSEKMSEIIAEGIVLDSSEDLKEMRMNSHKTPKQIREAKEAKKKKKTKT